MVVTNPTLSEMLRTDVSNSAYHSQGELSRSVAWSLTTSCPARVWYDMEHPTPSDAKHFVIGGCTHTATLEPFKLEDEYAVKPDTIDGNGPRTNAYKAAFQEMQDHAPDKRWLAQSDYDLCMGMADSAREHPLLQTYLDLPDTIIEGTGYFGYQGADCKVRPDLYNQGAGVVIDLKTTQEGDPRGFHSSVKRYGYDFQSCWYMEGLRSMGYDPKQFIFLVVEKTPPFLTSAYTIDAVQVEKQKSRMAEACRTWARCMKTGVWPGYGDHVQTIGTPERFEIANTRGRKSISEIAVLFKIDRQRVYRIIEQHGLKSEYWGRKRTIKVSEFTKAINQPRKVA